MTHKAIVIIGIACLLAVPSLVGNVWANHTVVNPYLKPPTSDRYYQGDKVTLLMNFSTGALAGDEILDNEGKVSYDAKITLQAISPPDSLVRPYSVGLAVPPNDHLLQSSFQIPVELTTGKWRITLDILERKTSNNVSIFSEPQVIDFDVYPKPAPTAPDNTVLLAVIGIVASVVIGWYFYWRTKKDQNNSKPVMHWEWFQEKVSADGTVTKIRIRLKEGHAPKVSVSINGEPLVWEKNGQTEFNMSGGDGGNLVIPPNQISPKSKVVVRVADHTFMKNTLGDIPKASG